MLERYAAVKLHGDFTTEIQRLKNSGDSKNREEKCNFCSLPELFFSNFREPGGFYVGCNGCNGFRADFR